MVLKYYWSSVFMVQGQNFLSSFDLITQNPFMSMLISGKTSENRNTVVDLEKLILQIFLRVRFVITQRNSQSWRR